jgi:putative peptidoglycan lipid II flippase
MPQMAIAQSTAIAALPTFSIQASQGRLDELKMSISATLRGIILLSMPAALGLILLRQPLVAFLYQRGEFDENSTTLVAWALAWYAAGLVGHSILELLSRAFYALHDTRTPVSVGVIAMALNIGFSFGLAELFKLMGWMPHGGLALANSLATAFEVITLYALLCKRLGGLNDRGFLLAFLQSGLGVLGMSVAVVIWDQSLGESEVVLTALGGVLLGAVVYGLILMLIKTPEVGQAIRAVKLRFRRNQ